MCSYLRLFLWLSLSGFSLTHTAHAQQLVLPSFFSDNMVLQRNATAHVWGWGQPTDIVVVKGSWSPDSVTATVDANGGWRVQLPTSGAGGPYELAVHAGRFSKKVRNVMLGDVWLCSGQSNMAISGAWGIKEVREELNGSMDSGIRLLHVNRTAAKHPQNKLESTWAIADSQTVRSFSAIGYFIAKNIRKEENVPVGIISASWGGTPAEVWTPYEYLEKDTVLMANARNIAPGKGRPHLPGSAWNAMVHPLVPYHIKGVFWYQGESNVHAWSAYDKLIKTMVSGWRSAWGGGTLPFYFVQIAPYNYKNKQPKAALLREQQSKTALELDHAGMAVITDLVPDINDIHPREKREVANRLFKMAAAEVYGKPLIDYKSPIYKSSRVVGEEMELSFHYLEGPLYIKGKEITELYIAGNDQVFYPAKGKIAGNKLIVSAKNVKHPVAVRFGFSETATPNLFNQNGLPVSPFRTDTWADPRFSDE